MSTTPGDDTLRDAGLEPVDRGGAAEVDRPDVVHVTQRVGTDPDALDEGEYEPDVALPDPDREADEADVVEQGDEVVLDDDREPF